MKLRGEIDFYVSERYSDTMTVHLQEKLNTLVKERKLPSRLVDDILKEIHDPWMEAQGLLKNKKINPVRYQKKIRKEWER